MRVVGGEAFVEPDLAPILAGDEVAKPLVGKFMGDESLAAADVLGCFRVEGAVIQGSEAGVVHAAPAVILDADLVILGPWVRDADFFFEEGHHVLGVLKGILGIFDFRGRGIEGEGDIAILVFDLLEIPRDE